MAAVAVPLGVGWMAQGIGLLPGSGFMDGDLRWAAFGAILAACGVVVAWTAIRMRRV